MNTMIIIFPSRSLVATMVHHWRAGRRDETFHKAVRAEFPECDLGTYKHAADEARKIIQGETP